MGSHASLALLLFLGRPSTPPRPQDPDEVDGGVDGLLCDAFVPPGVVAIRVVLHQCDVPAGPRGHGHVPEPGGASRARRAGDAYVGWSQGLIGVGLVRLGWGVAQVGRAEQEGMARLGWRCVSRSGRVGDTEHARVRSCHTAAASLSVPPAHVTTRDVGLDVLWSGWMAPVLTAVATTLRVKLQSAPRVHPW